MRYHSEDGSLTDAHHTKLWTTELTKVMHTLGLHPCPGPSLKEWAEQAGFQNITEHVFRLPIGSWPKNALLKELGLLNLTQVIDGLEGFSFRLLCDTAGWEESQVVELTNHVRAELKGKAFHAHVNL